MSSKQGATIPQYRHAITIPLSAGQQLLNPLRWQVGHWAFFGTLLTLAADAIAFLYLFNFFGVGRLFELEMWMIIAGIVGFVSIVAALWAIWFRSGRGIGIVALICGLMVGAPPAWLLGNTVLQFFLNGFSLPDAPAQW